MKNERIESSKEELAEFKIQVALGERTPAEAITASENLTNKDRLDFSVWLKGRNKPRETMITEAIGDLDKELVADWLYKNNLDVFKEAAANARATGRPIGIRFSQTRLTLEEFQRLEDYIRQEKRRRHEILIEGERSLFAALTKAKYTPKQYELFISEGDARAKTLPEILVSDELEQYQKDELLDMLMNPQDSFAHTGAKPKQQPVEPENSQGGNNAQ